MSLRPHTSAGHYEADVEAPPLQTIDEVSEVAGFLMRHLLILRENVAFGLADKPHPDDEERHGQRTAEHMTPGHGYLSHRIRIFPVFLQHLNLREQFETLIHEFGHVMLSDMNTAGTFEQFEDYLPPVLIAHAESRARDSQESFCDQLGHALGNLLMEKYLAEKAEEAEEEEGEDVNVATDEAAPSASDADPEAEPAGADPDAGTELPEEQQDAPKTTPRRYRPYC